MEYRPLGRSDIKVSALCLGAMTWGEQNTSAEGHAQLDRAFERGINFIDTAEMYSFPTNPATQGDSERIIGSWMQARGNRDQAIVATKIAGPSSGWLEWIRNGKTRLNRTHIEAAVETSLERLQTDYIDLYQLHWPQRNCNYFGKLGYTHDPDEDFIPIEETLEALNRLVEVGKIRTIGLSNETPWGVMEFLRVAEQNGWARTVSIQNPYNLLNRTFDIALSEIAHRENVGLLAYSPLAFGALTGKYLDGARPAGSRLVLYPDYARYVTEKGQRATRAYHDLALQHQLSTAQMALSFITHKAFVTSTIITATNLEQLDEDINAADLILEPELIEAIEAIHNVEPNPCP